MRNNSASTNQRSFTDSDACDDSRVTTNRRTLLHYGGNDFPVSISLWCAVCICCCWIDVVSEHHTVANKNFVFDDDTLTNKTV